MVYPHKWSPISCKSSAGQGKLAGQRPTFYHCATQNEFCTGQNSVKGQEPPKMYTYCSSPGDRQTSCKVWLASGERRRCSNEGKTRNPLKLARVLQTRQQISAASGSKFTILCRHVEEILLVNKFFPIVNMCLSCGDMARQSCAMVRRWRFF